MDTPPTENFLSTLPQISPQLLEQEGYSPFVQFPTLDLAQISQQLQTLLGLSALQIQPLKWEWKTGDEILSSYDPTSLSSLCIAVQPVNGYAFWIMNEHDINLIMTHVIAAEDSQFQFVDDDLRNGFYRYLAIEVLRRIDQAPSFQDYSIRLTKQQVTPSTYAFCCDIRICMENTHMIGRLILSNELVSGWQKSLAASKAHTTTVLKKSENLAIELNVQLDTLSFSVKEWKDVHPGDFIPLKKHTQQQPLAVNLVQEGFILFQANLDQNTLTIESSINM